MNRRIHASKALTRMCAAAAASALAATIMTGAPVAARAAEDTTAPIAKISVSKTGESGWHNGNAYLYLEARDAESGVASGTYKLSGAINQDGTFFPEPAEFVIAEEGQTLVSYWVADKAGNRDSGSFLVRIDTTAPTAAIPALPSTSIPVGTLVPASPSCEDQQSGVASCTMLADNVVDGRLDTSTPGTRSVRVATADNAGNRTIQDIPYTVVDVNAPTLTASTDRPADGAGGWWSAPYRVTFQAVDDVAVEGLSIGSAFVWADRATQTVNAAGRIPVEAVDSSNNTSDRLIWDARLDTTAPGITTANLISGATLTAGSSATLSYDGVDTQSGIWARSAYISRDGTKVVGNYARGTALPTQKVGYYQVRITVQNRAGLKATRTISYTVKAATPTVTASATAGTAGRAKIKAVITAPSGIGSFTGKAILSVDGRIVAAPSVTASGRYAYSATASNLKPGTHTLKIEFLSFNSALASKVVSKKFIIEG